MEGGLVKKPSWAKMLQVKGVQQHWMPVHFSIDAKYEFGRLILITLLQSVCLPSLVMMFVWERDFRQKVCFAIMPGSCHWDEVEQVHGQAGCLDGQRLGVREGAAGARLLQETEGENHCHLVPPGGCREDGPRLFSEVQESTRCKSLKGQESTACDTASSD